MTHGHEVLAMMQGHSYTERFYTCSAENLTAQGLIDFLQEHGKFMPMDDGFTVDTDKVCEHEK